VDSIPSVLVDRMGLPSLGIHTMEKVSHIARKYLLPKQIEHHGLARNSVQLDRRPSVLINGQAREAGVRNLERQWSAP
jgi:ATP-dependent Lon protease